MTASKQPLSRNLRKRWDDLLSRLQSTDPEAHAAAEGLLDESFASDKAATLPDFSTAHSPLDALMMYLRATQEWTSTRTMTEAILKGGYAKSDWTRRQNLRDAIDYATNSSGKLVRRADKKIGLPEWADEATSQP